MEENCSEDLGCDIVRIFDVNPMKKWPTNSIVLGGYPLMRMPFVVEDRNRPYLEDGESPITWFITYGSVRQQKNVLVYEILPFLMMKETTGGEIGGISSGPKDNWPKSHESYAKTVGNTS